MLKVSLLGFFCPINVSRYDFDLTTLTPGSIDPTGTSGRVSGWLHGAGTSEVSHFAFSSCIDLHSFDFQSSTLMAVLPLHPGLEGKSI